MTIAALVSNCSLSDANYFKQGIGTDVYSSELPSATALSDAYVAFICRQAGLAVEGETCDTPELRAQWTTFVQAGMNDIDRRCDAYLGWLDDRKRSQTSVLNELHALSAASIGIMTAAGVGVNPIAIVGLAFGLAADTFTNVQSRLVLEASHSTVQAVVLDNQSKYRRDVIGKVVDNKPAAIYLLRGYLRICMPFSIETSMNNTLAVYHRSGAGALGAQPGVFERPALIAAHALRDSIPAGPRTSLPGIQGQPGGAKRERTVGNPQTDTEDKLPISKGQEIQGNLCVAAANGNFGPETREAIRQAKVAANQSRRARSTPPLFRTVNNQIDSNDEAQIFLGARHCELDRSGNDRAYLTAFEKYRFADEIAVKDFQVALAKCDANVRPTGIFDQATRTGISTATGLPGSSVARTDRLTDASYTWVVGRCI